MWKYFSDLKANSMKKEMKKDTLKIKHKQIEYEIIVLLNVKIKFCFTHPVYVHTVNVNQMMNDQTRKNDILIKHSLYHYIHTQTTYFHCFMKKENSSSAISERNKVLF